MEMTQSLNHDRMRISQAPFIAIMIRLISMLLEYHVFLMLRVPGPKPILRHRKEEKEAASSCFRAKERRNSPNGIETALNTTNQIHVAQPCEPPFVTAIGPAKTVTKAKSHWQEMDSEKPICR